MVQIKKKCEIFWDEDAWDVIGGVKILWKFWF